MEVKNVLFAAVGAPVVAARKIGTKVEGLRERFSKEKNSYTKAAEEAITGWAAEGEKLVAKISDGKVVEEISAKVDLDQAKEQVGKLRDQLEDMISTWRHSFRPEKGDAGTEASATAAKKPAAKTSAAKKPAAKTSTAKKPAAKTSTAKSTKSASATKASTAKAASASKAKSGS